MKKRGDVEAWVKKAISKGYTTKDLRRVLLKSGYTHKQLLPILVLHEKLKSKIKPVIKKQTPSFIKAREQKPTLSVIPSKKEIHIQKVSSIKPEDNKQKTHEQQEVSMGSAKIGRAHV